MLKTSENVLNPLNIEADDEKILTFYTECIGLMTDSERCKLTLVSTPLLRRSRPMA